jgi:sec-independent protein translocase protein TatB
MFGLTFEKMLVIAVIAAFIIGPQRLPLYAEKLAVLFRTLRGFTDTAKARVVEELGPDFDKEDWKKLDPRQYDPRRIVQDALADDAVVSDGSAIAAPTPLAPVAAGGWQEALLARVGPSSQEHPPAR